MGFDIGTLGMQAAGDVVDTGLGLLLEHHNDNRQANQQQRLTDIQTKAQEQLTDYSYDKQLQMWKDTNYPAQMEQIEKAGLNPALLYGLHGGGGVTTGTAGATSVSGGEAPKGGGEILELRTQMLQQQMMAAQIEQIKADAADKTADANQKNTLTPTTNTNIQTQTASIAQGIKNQQAAQALTEAQTKMQNLQNTITGETLENVIAQIDTQTSIIYNQLQSSAAQSDLDTATVQDRINTVHTMAIGAILNNDLTRAKTGEAKSNIQVNTEQIQQMAASISQKWQELTNVSERNADTNRMQEQLNEYIHNMPDSWKVSQEAISGILHVVTGNLKLGTTTPTRNPIGYK